MSRSRCPACGSINIYLRPIALLNFTQKVAEKYWAVAVVNRKEAEDLFCLSSFWSNILTDIHIRTYFFSCFVINFLPTPLVPNVST